MKRIVFLPSILWSESIINGIGFEYYQKYRQAQNYQQRIVYGSKLHDVVIKL